MANPIYPTRSFIRFQAKRQLTADMSGQQVMTFVSQDSSGSQMDVTLPNPPEELQPLEIQPTLESYQDNPQKAHYAAVNHQETKDSFPNGLDESLFKEIADLTFHPDQHPEIYQPCQSIDAANAIEQAIAIEIVDTYKRIKVNATKPSIQSLNALL
ncbi:MAG: hypothetical protein AAGD25_21355 [Cyanobacteria bacterium P01_F01_bin.150]